MIFELLDAETKEPRYDCPIERKPSHAGLWTGTKFLNREAQLAGRPYDVRVVVDTRALHAVLRGIDVVTAVAVTPDAATVVSGDWDRTVRIWDGRTGTVRAVLAGHTDLIEAVAVTPDGATIVSGSGDCTVRVWDACTGSLHAVLSGHTRGVQAVAVTPDGATVLTGSWDHTVRVWNARSGAARAVLAGHTDVIRAIAVTPDGPFSSPGATMARSAFGTRTQASRAPLSRAIPLPWRPWP